MKTRTLKIESAKNIMEANPSLGLLLPVLMMLGSASMGLISESKAQAAAKNPQVESRQEVAPSKVSRVIAKSAHLFHTLAPVLAGLNVTIQR